VNCSFKDFGEKCRAWDRDFGWTYRSALFVAVLVGLIWLPFWIFSRAQVHLSSPASPSLGAQSAVRPAPSSGRSLAAVPAPSQFSSAISPTALYPYSVIPGGAHSRDELARAIANDPVVARHYADFDVSRARVVRLDHSEAMYVSYRIGDVVYWAKKPLTIRAGETLLTDGKRTARTRCGNRLSFTPASPVSEREPALAALDKAPELPAVTALLSPAELPLLLADVLPGSGSARPTVALAPTGPAAIDVFAATIPAPYFPVVGGRAQGPPIYPGPPIPVATPEPSTLPLVLAGLLVLVGVYRRKSRSPACRHRKLS
jgi:hypothetical protein